MTTATPTGWALPTALLLSVAAAPASAQLSEELVRAYLWPASEEEAAEAADALASDPSLDALDRGGSERLEAWMRAGPRRGPPGGVGDAWHEITVPTPGRREVPTLVRLPSSYTPDRQWPLLLAMHGGPTGSVEGALRGALGMVSVWAEAADEAGWIVAAPAMVDVVARDGRTEERLPYEIFHAQEARAVLDAVRARFSVDPDRIVSTGISLGSNFSIAFAAAHPDWFSAIVPVSTEGESREWLLRNLAPVPTYVLEGAQDQNIRAVSGPRAMDAIMGRIGSDWVYREFSDRAHEGFQERYPEVLAWLDARPRETAPEEVLRVPHRGIVPPSRRVHWIEADARQALVRARVAGETEIEVTVRWAGAVTVLLNDHLVDLDRPITIRVNGAVAFSGPVERSARVALEEAKRWNDERSVYTARVRMQVPTTPSAVGVGKALTEELRPEHPEGTLSFWETYAVRALEERLPGLGFSGEEVALPDPVRPAPEQVALRITDVDPDGPAGRAGLRAGDVLVSFGQERFYEGRGGTAGLYAWLVRELRETPATYQLTFVRGDSVLTIRPRYALGPYRPPA